MALSNLDSYDSIRLYEAWLQQQFLGDKISLRLGQLAADEEFALTDFGAVFRHSSTGWPTHISGGAPNPVYPYAVPGVRLEVKPIANSFIRFGAYDGDPDPGDANGKPLNSNGIRYNLGEGAFLIAETGYTWGGDPKGGILKGTAKIGRAHV